MKGSSTNAGDLICKVVKQYNIHQIVTGRRDMGEVKRFFLGSVSKFILEHAECNVVVVKVPIGSEEEHVDKQKIIQAEETERIRRIVEDEETIEKEQENREATLQKVIADEEKERKERISEEGKFTKNRLDKMFHIFAFHEELKKRNDH